MKNNIEGASDIIGSDDSIDKYSFENEEGKLEVDCKKGSANQDQLKVDPKDFDGFDDEDKNKNTSRVGMVLNLLKSIKAGVGSDLTNVELPGSFVLPRSSLTFFSEIFINNFDILLNINNKESETERLLGVLKYANTVLIEIPDATRKPLNPILGEQRIGQFQVLKQDSNGNSIISTDNHYCIEQVSHHPPLSVISVYNIKEGIKINFTAPLKFIFAGTYFKVPFDGDLEIHLEHHNETYRVTIPTLCGRYLRGFTEFVGTSIISSSKSQYYIKSQYHAKPLLGGSYNYFESYLFKGSTNNSGGGSIISSSDCKLFKIFGQWNGESKIIDYSISSKESKPFYKRKESSLVKVVEHISPKDSNVVWQGVINAHKQGNMKLVTREKSKVEVEQRQLAAERIKNNETWVPKFFKKDEQTGKWVFTNYQE